jgi:glycosyltransferase involved in cell wall biosynthesis
MRTMCLPYYGDQVEYWPVGIETEKWSPAIKGDEPKIDFLIYDKIRWDHELYKERLINPIIQQLASQNLSYALIRYGHYQPADLKDQLSRAKAVIFLCEHETQGIAYQQILATGTPILAWNRGGFWQDPHYYPHNVKYEPVSSVPYWDERCGLKFKNKKDFPARLEDFLFRLDQNDFDPRAYILENLTLEISAKKYVDIYQTLR